MKVALFQGVCLGILIFIAWLLIEYVTRNASRRNDDSDTGPTWGGDGGGDDGGGD